MIRFFVAHPKGMPAEELSDSIAALRDVILDFSDSDAAFTLTSGVEDFKRRADECGGWAAWNASVPRMYDAIVALQPAVGKATAEQITEALGLLRDVYYFDRKTKRLRAVWDVKTVDEKDYRTGWSLVFKGAA